MSAEHDIIRRLEYGPTASKVDLVTDLGRSWSEIEAGLDFLRTHGLVEEDTRNGNAVYRLAAGSREKVAAALSL